MIIQQPARELTLRERATEEVDRQYQSLSYSSWALLWGTSIDDGLRNVRRMGSKEFLRKQKAMLDERVEARIIVLSREQQQQKGISK